MPDVNVTKTDKAAKAGAEAQSSAEQRREARVRSYLRGRILFNGRKSIMDCVVRNISARGAKLLVSDGGVLPASFELEIPHYELKRHARVTWRGHDELGVEFDGTADAAEEKKKMAKLEAENNRLRSIVRDKTNRGEID